MGKLKPSSTCKVRLVGIRAKLTAAALFLSAACSFSGELRAESAFGETRGTVNRISDPDENAPKGDGVYGRFNGDVSFQIGAGAEIPFDTGSARPLLTGDVTLYQTVGLYGSYRHGLGSRDPWARAVSAGVTVSPLFLIRFPRSWETGAAFFDLTLDSLALTAGAALAEPIDGTLLDQVVGEFGLQAGAPLLGKANGLWLRARGSYISGPDAGAAAWLWLSWQGFVHAGIFRVDK
jgi:hypothetical protein